MKDNRIGFVMSRNRKRVFGHTVHSIRDLNNQALVLSPQQLQFQLHGQAKGRFFNSNYEFGTIKDQQQQRKGMIFPNSPVAGFGGPQKVTRGNWRNFSNKRPCIRKPSKRLTRAGVYVMAHTGNIGGYNGPRVNDSWYRNSAMGGKIFSNGKFGDRFVANAPRNTTSFIIRAKKSGGVADFVLRSPVTPEVLPTPELSPCKEALGEVAKEEWGVDGYGSMEGLIRLKSEAESRKNEQGEGEDSNEVKDEMEGDCWSASASSESDKRKEEDSILRKLDNEANRFEMAYPNNKVGYYNNLLVNRLDDQDAQIEQLEDENSTLKDRISSMKRELGELKTRIKLVEMRKENFNDWIIYDATERVSEK